MQYLILIILLTFLMSIMLGFITIPLLTQLKFGQRVREDGPKKHLVKSGTPTMGGMIFILPLIITTLIFTYDSFDFIFLAILLTLGNALIGFFDDYIKVVLKRSLGLKAKHKLAAQIALAISFSLIAFLHPDIGSSVWIPFTDGASWDLGLWYIPFTSFVIVATTNSLNLTDGLDGLASGVSLIVVPAFILIALMNSYMPDFGITNQLPNTYETLIIFGAALTGGILGFLKFNKFPAKVFMGDTGSMGLGGAIAAIAIMLRQPFLLPILGGVYMIETLSVIIQVTFFRLTGRKIFKMSPLHHHFELVGMSENKIVASFMLVTLILSIIGLFAV